MIADIEIIAYKDNIRTVRTYTTKLYNGITTYYYDKMKKLGYKNISIRVI